jgi:hypothetical protein
MGRKSSIPRSARLADAISWIFDSGGYIVLFLVILSVYFAYVIAILRYPSFPPPSNVEEQAYTYLSAANFNRFGFLFTGFLQNFATSPDIGDHPYVYSHMPPGPDIATALLLRATGGSYALTGIVLASFVPAGFVFYLLFIRRVLAEHNLIGGGFALVFTQWMQYLTQMARPISAPFLLLAFLPLFALQYSYDTKRPWLFAASLPVVLLSAVYLDYVVLSSVVMCWILLYLTQLLRVDGRHVLCVLAVIGFGIFLNLLKNFLYFGPDLFVQELVLLLSNRITGFPTQDMLAAFYGEHGIVHHGARPPNLAALRSVVWTNIDFPGFVSIVVAVVLCLGLSLRVRPKPGGRLPAAAGLTRIGRGDARYLLRLTVWAMGTVLAPVILFPAFGQEVNLYGIANSVWMGVFAIGAASLVAARAFAPLWSLARRRWLVRRGDVRAGLQFWPRRIRRALVASLAVLAVVVLGNAVLAQVRQRQANVTGLVPLYTQGNINTQLEPLRTFSQGFFMTNINTPTVYFYVQRPGFGVCGLSSIGDDGAIRLDGCKIAFMRNKDKYLASRPAFFFQFRRSGYFPGFADCMPSGTLMAQMQEARAPAGCFEMQEDRLRKNYSAVFSNTLFTVYDLRTVSRR